MSTRKILDFCTNLTNFSPVFSIFYSARKYFQEGKIIIFIKPKADVQGRRNPQNITSYMSQNITVFIQIVGLEMEKFVNQLHVSLQEAFIGNIWLKNTSLIMTKYIMTISRNFFTYKCNSKYGFFQVFQCEVCPEKFAYQEMLKFHLQQKHDKQVHKLFRKFTTLLTKFML